MNQELDSFTHNVSHDLKEPLRAIEAFSKFLVEDYSDKLDDQGRQYLETIGRASVRMKTLIHDLLTLSRLSKDMEPPVKIDLAEAVAEVRKQMELTIDEKKATIDIDDGMPPVLGDPTRIVQVLTNLIGNGLKFNKSEHPVVKIGLRSQGEAVGTFYVQDNGIGIAPEHHSRVFGIFQRLHRRDDYEGSGAGLSIVQRAVESLGGKVWVESELGAGATFIFTLPLWTEGAQGDAAEAA